MMKACRRSRVGKWCIWLALKWNEYSTNAARQTFDYLRIERAVFFNVFQGGKSIVTSNVIDRFALDYLFHSKTTHSGRTMQFSTKQYDPLRRSEAASGYQRFLTVTYTVCGHRLTALYRADTGVFPPCSDFSAYEGLGDRSSFSQQFSLLRKDEKKAPPMSLNTLLQECRGPVGQVSATPGETGENWITSDTCPEHAWPTEHLVMFAASLTSDRSWMRAVETRQVEIAVDQIG